jgi:hypothetical protein
MSIDVNEAADIGHGFLALGTPEDRLFALETPV